MIKLSVGCNQTCSPLARSPSFPPSTLHESSILLLPGQRQSSRFVQCTRKEGERTSKWTAGLGAIMGIIPPSGTLWPDVKRSTACRKVSVHVLRHENWPWGRHHAAGDEDVAVEDCGPPPPPNCWWSWSWAWSSSSDYLNCFLRSDILAASLFCFSNIYHFTSYQIKSYAPFDSSDLVSAPTLMKFLFNRLERFHAYKHWIIKVFSRNSTTY